MGRPIKAHRSNRSNRPINRPVNRLHGSFWISNRSNRPVNRSEPVVWEFLNLFEFGFEFNRFPPVTGPTGPVNRNRWPAVWVNRSGKKKTLAVSCSLVVIAALFFWSNIWRGSVVVRFISRISVLGYVSFTLVHRNASLPNHAYGVTNDLVLRCFIVANHAPLLPILWE